MESNITAPEAAPVTENAAPDATPVSTETTKPAEAKAPAPAKEAKAAVNTDEKAYRLSELIRITEKDPNKVLSDEDQAIYEEWVDNKIQPKDRPEKKEPEAKEEEKAEKVEKVEKVEKPEVTPAIEAAMKEVGAKSLDELPAKIKELRAAVSGKETAAIQKAKQEAEQRFNDAAKSEAALWRDFMEGKPAALAYVRDTYGLEPKTPTQTQRPQDTDFDPDILADADALTGGITSKVIAQNKALQERLEKLEGTFQGQQKQTQLERVKESITAQMVDDMIAMGQNMDGIKDIPNLRNVIIDRIRNGKEDPRLDAFNEIFEIAEKENVTPQQAFLIKKGRDAELLIAKAREEGLQQAYKHKPNKSLSSIQTEDAEPQSITDSQIAEMEKDFRKIPDGWFVNGELVKAKVPKKAWAALGLE